MTQHRYKFIGCEVIYREACLLAATCENQVDVEFLRKGLHDLETADMRARVQKAIDAVEDDDRQYEAILLGYARCNDGVVGLKARSLPLVIPRAHDCITLFFGSREAYAEYFESHPGTYYRTTGWTERDLTTDQYAQPAYRQQGVVARMGLAESYEKLVEQYGEDNAEFIQQMMGDWTKHYNRCCYLEMGVGDETSLIDRARQEAEEKGWEFEKRPGDWSLLKKLFAGRWDDDFVIVQPGQQLKACNDHRVLEAE